MKKITDDEFIMKTFNFGRYELKAFKEVMKEAREQGKEKTEKRLIPIIFWLVCQSCETDKGNLDDQCISAYQRAIRILDEYGLIEDKKLAYDKIGQGF